MQLEKTLAGHTKIVLAMAFVLVFMSGCAANRSKSGDADGGQSQTSKSAALSQYEVIAIDLVNAMVQIDELHPANLPDIKIDAVKGSFGGALYTVLESAGYNVKQPELGLVVANLEWSITPAASTNDTAGDTLPQSFSISIRDATLSRDYQLNPTQVQPVSNLKLLGVKNTPIKLHDALFDQTVVPSKKARSTQARRDDANAALGGGIRNIFEIGGSNYQEQVGMFNSVGTFVINFNNDSGALSGKSRIQLRRFLSSVNRDTDAVWVIGCSIGPTKLQGGNETLARERTSVVVQWLKKSGISTERLLDESCWAETPGGLGMPRRGVQLTLLRERKN